MRVLIVDDSWSMRAAVRELLERRAYTVVGEADSAAGALEAIEWLQPDGVLIDVRLPDGDGVAVAAQLSATHPDLPVLLMSATEDDVGDAAVRRAGATGFVRKSDLAAADLDRLWRLTTDR
jgi:DNA-binding NarL/FixJ family response regulator